MADKEYTPEEFDWDDIEWGEDELDDWLEEHAADILNAEPWDGFDLEEMDENASEPKG